MSQYCLPNYKILDQERIHSCGQMNYLFKKLNIKIKTVAPYNQQSLQVEHGIK